MAVADALWRAGAARAAKPAPAGALVLGGDYRALGVVRSLGRRGVPVWVIRDGGDAVATPRAPAVRPRPRRRRTSSSR